MLELRAYMFEHVYLGEDARREHEPVEAGRARLVDHGWERADDLPDHGGGRAQRVVDYIAGMTDRFALQTRDALRGK
jgi:dGTPase